jgi:DNA polymerase V
MALRITEIYRPELSTPLVLRLFLCRVPAGFPSPADDYLDEFLDLNQKLITNRSATFLARAEGNSMQGAGIFSGDLLIVDRSLKPIPGKVVVASLNGELTVLRTALGVMLWAAMKRPRPRTKKFSPPSPSALPRSSLSNDHRNQNLPRSAGNLHLG